MKLRRYKCQPDDLIELIDSTGTSATKLRILRGARGNLQVLVYTQPSACVHVDPSVSERREILQKDPSEFDL